MVTLTIDARTRAAKRIHTPFLALLGESRLGIGLLARDGDQVTRRFSLAIPTEDGAFPTLEGRLCRTFKQQCTDGLINYSLGAPLAHVSMKSVLENQDPAVAERWFRGRIVLIGETQPYSDRVPVPVNLAGWETVERESPAIVVHAQALRTALGRSAPADASNAVMLLLITVAGLVVLTNDWKIAAAWGVLARQCCSPAPSSRCAAVFHGLRQWFSPSGPRSRGDAWLRGTHAAVFPPRRRILRTRGENFPAASPGYAAHDTHGSGFPSSPGPSGRREAKSMPPDFISPRSPGRGELVFLRQWFSFACLARPHVRNRRCHRQP